MMLKCVIFTIIDYTKRLDFFPWQLQISWVLIFINQKKLTSFHGLKHLALPTKQLTRLIV